MSNFGISIKKLYQLIFPLGIACFVVFSGMVFSPLSADAAFPEGFSTEVVASGLFIPTVFDFASDGRIFIAEKNGLVRIVKNGQVLPTPFLQLTDINTHGDRGLIGMALDEDFEQNGYVYLSYTYENNPADPFGPKTSRIVRVTANGDVADMNTYTVLVGSVGGSPAAPSCHNFSVTDDCIPSDSESHSVGGLRFHDGYLWASTGDGAGFTFVDPNAYLAQNLDSLAGKFLRLNRDGTAPTDNPYFDGDPTSNRSKVYAYGFRNAYRFSVRPSTNEWFVADVGWYHREELNVVVAGGNYGWPCKEGTLFHEGYACLPSGPGVVVDPIYEYERDYASNPHDAIAITGGDFIYAPAYPAVHNDTYVFSDFHRNTISRIVLGSGNSVLSVEEWTNTAAGPVAMYTGPDEYLYYLSIFTGQLRRIAHRAEQLPPSITAVVGPLSGSAPHTTSFDATGSSDPEGSTLSFLWTFGDGEYAEGAFVEHVYTSPGIFVARLSVVDEDGNISRESFTIVVDGEEAGGEPSPVLTNVTLIPSEIVVGSIVSINITARNDGMTAPVRYLTTVYNTATGALVKSEDVVITVPSEESRTVTHTWIPEASGTYRVAVTLTSSDAAHTYEHTPEAAIINVADRHPTGGSGPFRPSLALLVPSPLPAFVGSPLTIHAEIKNTGLGGVAWSIITVSNPAGVNVFENVQEVPIVSGGTVVIEATWTPTTDGVFYIDLGLFSADWSNMFEWNWRSATVLVSVSGGQTPPSTNAPFSVSIAGSSAGSGAVGVSLPVSVEVKNDGDAGVANILLVVNDGSTNIHEHIYDSVAFNALETKSFTDVWIPATPGTYYLDAGLFSADWSEMYQWGWRLQTITVTDEANDPTPDPFRLTITSANAASGVVGAALPLSAVVANTGAAGTGQLLFIVNDGAVNIHERVFGDVVFADLQSLTFDDAWIPTSAGTYYFDVGLFSSDWSEMYQWGWRLQTITVTDEANDPTPDPFRLTITSANAASGVVGAALPLSAVVANTGAAGTGQLLFIVNDGAVNIHERVFGDVVFADLQSLTFDDAWIPTSAGTYYFDVGLFSSDWSEMYQWGWRLGTMVVDDVGAF